MAVNKKPNAANSVNPLRNYLILVVGFAAFVSVSVGIAIAFASQHLNQIQLWILIAFLAIFPIIALGIITQLILRFTNKLTVGEHDDAIDWEIVSAIKQKENINLEVSELAKAMKVPAEQMNDLRSAYIVAEDLALRKIQQEAEIPLMRYVNIGDAEFNALCIDKDLITCVEVTFVVTPDIKQKKISNILKKLASAKSTLRRIREGSRIRLLLVIVTQLDREGEAKLRSSLVSKFTSTPVDVDIRLLDFHTLQQVYAEE